METKPGSRRPFIAKAGLNLPGQSSAVIRIRVPRGGKLGCSWRETGNRDFPPGQSVTLEVPASEQIVKRTIKLPTRNRIIHVRLLMPTSGAVLESVEFQDAEGNALQSWDFRNDSTSSYFAPRDNGEFAARNTTIRAR